MMDTERDTSDDFDEGYRIRLLPKEEVWIYGFQFKNRYVRQKAEELQMWLPEECAAPSVPVNIKFYVQRRCGKMLKLLKVRHSGGYAGVLGFVKVEEPITEEERRRIVEESVNQEDVVNLRNVLGLPENTEPKWYEGDDTYGSNDAGISDDETPEEVIQALLKKD